MSERRPKRFQERDGMLLAGLRRRHPFADAATGIADQWRDFAEMEPIPGAVGHTRFGVMCGSDPGGFEYMCAVEVGSLADMPAGIGRMRVPAQTYAVFEHPAGEASLQDSWGDILEWLGDGDYESAHRPDFEEYPPGEDPRNPQSSFEIWVGVVPRAPRS